MQNGTLQPDFAQELVDALWLKYSEWVWTISANTADYFAGYNQFQNLTVGGKTRSGQDGTNTVTFMAMKATEECKTYQPGLSVRLQADCPPGIYGCGHASCQHRHSFPGGSSWPRKNTG